MPVHVREEGRVVAGCLLEAILKERVEVVVEALAHHVDFSTLTGRHKGRFSATSAHIEINPVPCDQALDHFKVSSSTRKVDGCSACGVLRVDIGIELLQHL